MAHPAATGITTPPALRLYLLGSLRIERNDQPIRLPRRKVELLLAFLLLHPEQHPREKVAALLWGDFTDAQARASLRNALAVLRKELGDDIILTEHERIQLNPHFPVWADARELQIANQRIHDGQSQITNLQSEVGLYRGDLLSEFYDDWVILDRERLLALFEEKMQQLLELLVGGQYWPQVLEWSERWIALGQTPEPAYCALMIAYAHLGDRSKVATVFQRCTDALRDELGVEPSEETRTLYEQLSKGERLSAISLTLVRRFGVQARLFEEDEPPEPGEAPYKGLQFFEESDADLFFGRELLIAKLVGQLRDNRFLAVIVGASGSGKSSIVRAGLVATLKRGEPLADGTLPPEGSQDWIAHIMTPTLHPLQALAASFTGGSESGTERQNARLADEMLHNPQALENAMQSQGVTQTLLVVDQFEELFTLCSDEIERKAFVDSLMFAASPESNSVTTIVITLRADFYAHCAQYPKLREALATHQEYIGPMNAEELRHAIEQPARNGGWEFEPGLVDFMLRDVGDEPGALPLLSHALLETWKRRRGHFLTLKGYAESGGVRGAIAKTAETTYRELTPQQGEIARRIFLRLTELGEGTEDTRRRASFKELVPHPEAAADVQDVLKILADARLVTMGEETAEVAHEALIREWPTLREWLTQGREGLLVHRHLTQSAQEWEELGRDAGALYRGARLGQANDWAQANSDEVNVLERAFLEASQKSAEREEAEREEQRQKELEAAQKLAAAEKVHAQEQRQAATRLRRRALYLAGAFVVALLMAGAALFFGAQARERQVAEQTARETAERQERLASSRELAAAAITNLDVDPQLSILLAQRAIRTTYDVDGTSTSEAENALHRAVGASHEVLTLSGHKSAVWDLAYSPDGKRIVTASQDKTARIWNAATGQELLTLQDAAAVNSVAFSPDGKRIATASDDHTAKVWDSLTGQALLTLTGHSDLVMSVAFSPDGSHLATSSVDKTAKVWDLATGKVQLTVTHADAVADLAFNQDGTKLVTNSADGKVKVWDVASGRELLTLIDQPGGNNSVAFSRDGTLIAASAFAQNSAKVWEAATGKELLSLTGHTNSIANVAFSPDGTSLATVSLDRKVKIWILELGMARFTLSGHAGPVNSVAFSPDGTRVATASRDGTAKVWDVSPSHELLSISAPDGSGRIAWSPDGTRLAEGFAGGTTKVWDAATGRELHTLSKHAEDVVSLAFSPDGKRLATISGDGIVKVWDTSSGKELITFSERTGPGIGLAFSPDGTRIATSSDDHMIRIWDASNGKELLTLSGHQAPVLSVAFSPDGTRLVSGDADGKGILWDTHKGEQIHTLMGHSDTIWGVAYSRDGTRVATASRDGTAKVWDVATGKDLLTLRGHTSTIVNVAFSPDGKRIATGSRDATAKVWDAATGKELLTLYGDNFGMGGVAFSPDSTRLATAGDDAVRVYVLPIEDLMALARSRLTRTWTLEECQTFLHAEQCP